MALSHLAAGGLSAYGLVFTADAYTLAGGPLTLAGTGGVIDVGSGFSTTISAAVGGTVGLTKNGLGTLVLSGTNTYTGVTTVSCQGPVRDECRSTRGIGSGQRHDDRGRACSTLQVSGAITIAEALTLNGTGVANAAALRKTAANTTIWTGGITLGSAARINSDAGTLTVSGGISGTGLALTVGGRRGRP